MTIWVRPRRDCSALRTSCAVVPGMAHCQVRFGSVVILGSMQVESKPDGLCGGERSVRLLFSWGRDVKEGCGLEPVLGQAHWWIGGAIWEDGAKVAASKTPVGKDRSNEQPRSVTGCVIWLKPLGKLNRNVAGVEGAGKLAHLRKEEPEVGWPNELAQRGG